MSRIAPLLLVLACAGRAIADERELIVSAQPGFSLLRVAGQSALGGGAGVDVSYGITDALALRVTGALTAHDLGATAAGPAGTALAYHAGAGATYTIDILRLVPYLDFSIGILGVRQPTVTGAESRNDLGFEIGLGLDYLISRRWAVGAVVRYHAYLTAISEIPVYLYAGPRIAVHFGG